MSEHRPMKYTLNCRPLRSLGNGFVLGYAAHCVTRSRKGGRPSPNPEGITNRGRQHLQPRDKQVAGTDRFTKFSKTIDSRPANLRNVEEPRGKQCIDKPQIRKYESRTVVA